MLNKLYWWVLHLGHLHYLPDLGAIVRIESFTWGDVLFRECTQCGRVFVDFGSGL